MQWTFSESYLQFNTEQGVILRQYKVTTEGLYHFNGGTLIQCPERGWYGGVDINHRRYFIRPDGVLIPKSYEQTTLAPYTFVREGDHVRVRLWEPIEHLVIADKVVQIKNVNYLLDFNYMNVKALSKRETISLKKHQQSLNFLASHSVK